MSFYIIKNEKYIYGIGVCNCEHESSITKSEYETIRSIIGNKPVAPGGYDYRLTTKKEWELYELPIVDDDPEISEAEALGIILGGVV